MPYRNNARDCNNSTMADADLPLRDSQARSNFGRSAQQGDKWLSIGPVRYLNFAWAYSAIEPSTQRFHDSFFGGEFTGKTLSAVGKRLNVRPLILGKATFNKIATRIVYQLREGSNLDHVDSMTDYFHPAYPRA